MKISPTSLSIKTLSMPVILLLATACGLSVANIYYVHPMLNVIAADLHMNIALAGSVITATQICYACGLLFLVPLGDLLPRRQLIIGQMLVSALCLLFVATASGSTSFWIGIGLIGGLAVVAQTIIAAAASMSAPQQRGQTIGFITSGIVIGILLARVLAGLLTDLAGWRSVYGCSAAALLLIVVLLYRYMPATPAPSTRPSYGQLVLSTLQLFRELPVLRIRALLAMMIFAAFGTLWTALVFPLSIAPFYFSHSTIGLLGIAGLAGAVAASRAGVWADRGWAQRTSGIALALLVLSWVFMWNMYHSVWFLIVGIIVLDLAVQAVHVTSQSMILSARPQAESRLTGAYMVFYSIGSALGSLAATWVYARYGWNGVCWLGLSFSGVALLCWTLTQRMSSVPVSVVASSSTGHCKSTG
ncbi:MFS transporter [Paenibacillus hunanensis]|uniref:MFS transporter n=1 Tax=Paenibacillus hunanensis TaxID=539262 RepID=UPI002027658F|nr:MFS transporter [Paenibacillus hunanensis]MCL9663377.1 MFS transporter [Paenibacillus hunanensis]